MEILVAVHAIGGVALLVLGLLAFTARKSKLSRHPLVGEIYFWTLAVTLTLGMVDGYVRHPASLSIFQVVTPPTLAFGVLGYLMAKRRPARFLGRPWLFWHILGQGSSYIGVVTAASFQVFPRFMPDARVVTMAYWIVPSAVGTWLIVRTMGRWKPPILVEGRLG